MAFVFLFCKNGFCILKFGSIDNYRNTCGKKYLMVEYRQYFSSLSRTRAVFLFLVLNQFDGPLRYLINRATSPKQIKLALTW